MGEAQHTRGLAEEMRTEEDALPAPVSPLLRVHQLCFRASDAEQRGIKRVYGWQEAAVADTQLALASLLWWDNQSGQRCVSLCEQKAAIKLQHSSWYTILVSNKQVQLGRWGGGGHAQAHA